MPITPSAASWKWCFWSLSVGAPANLVVLDQPDEVEALRYHGPPAHVISRGKWLDAAKMQAIVAAGAGTA